MTGKAVVTFKRLLSQHGVPFSRTHIDRLEKAKPPKFPKSFKLNDFRGSPRVWWEHEIIEWLEARAKASTDAPK
jgi:predicted DNA-binding transcriptional regulator AlpA